MTTLTNWQIKKLGEICKIKKGKNPTLASIKNEDYLPYLGAKFLRGTKEPEYASIHDKKSVIVSNSDLIIICDGSKSGDMFSDFEGILSSTMGKMEFDTNLLHPKYLKNFLDLNFDLFNGSKKGAAIPHLDFQVFNSLEIPLSPLEEQKRIVAILDKKLGKIAKAKKLREEALVDTEKILSQTLTEIFEEGREKGWEEKEIQEVAEIKGGKRLPKGRTLLDKVTNHPYLRVTDFKNGILNKNQVRFIDEETFKEIERYIISSDDIFISIAGTTGHVCKIPEAFNNANLTENAAKITNIKSGLLKDFLFLQLQTDNIQKELGSRTIQTTISKLALYKIAEQKILIPALFKQKEIVRKLDELSACVAQLRELQKEQLSDLKKLEKSLLREAFNGEL